jgi:hypothetical protein
MQLQFHIKGVPRWVLFTDPVAVGYRTAVSYKGSTIGYRTAVASLQMGSRQYFSQKGLNS